MESLQPLYTLATRGSRSQRCANGPDLALLKLLYATISGEFVARPQDG
jgi:hypothetical protein